MKLNKITFRSVVKFVGSRKFFVITIALFVFQAGWIALSANYPQAFDEQYHFGLIQIYAQHISPFLGSQPSGAGQYGPVAVDPSYLYHYLFSFVYRLLTHLTYDTTTQIIILRLFNVALLAWGLAVFRKVLSLAPISNALANTAIFLFVALPVVPLLGGQINYDNLIIPLSGLAILWGVSLAQTVQRQKSIPIPLLIKLILLFCLASLVKYEFLAVAFGVIVVIAWAIVSSCKKKPLSKMLVESYKQTSKAVVVGGVIAVILGMGMFAQRYGVDVVKYHKIPPRCEQVLSPSDCALNGPWTRSHTNHNTQPPLTILQKVTYPWRWIKVNIRELIFSITSSFASDGTTVNYYTSRPLPVFAVGTWVSFTAGFVLIVCYFKRLWRDPVTKSFIIISLFYLVTLLGKNYLSFLHERQIAAVHGRYLFPVLILLFGLALISLKWFVEEHKLSSKLKLGMSLLACVTLLQGGGLITYIVRSDSSWLWPDRPTAITVNSKTRSILNNIIVH